MMKFAQLDTGFVNQTLEMALRSLLTWIQFLKEQSTAWTEKLSTFRGVFPILGVACNTLQTE